MLQLSGFEDEMNVGPDKNAAIRFHGKLYGRTKVHQGFSIALARELDPHNFGVKVVKDGVTFYIEEDDLGSLRVTILMWTMMQRKILTTFSILERNGEL